MSNELKHGIVSIWQGVINPKANTASGSGFCVAERFVVTAWHVVEGLDPSDIYIGLLGVTDAGRQVHKVHHPDGLDIALLELHQPHEKTLLTCDFETRIVAGHEVELCACRVGAREVTAPDTVTISNAAQNGELEFVSYPAPGMSGGGVFYQGKVVGVIKDSYVGDNSGVFLPLYLAVGFLKQQLPEIFDQSTIASTTHRSPESVYIRKQTLKLAALLAENQAIKSAFIGKYTPSDSDIETGKLAGVIADKLCNPQGGRLDEALGDVRAVFNRIYANEEHNAAIVESAEGLFNTCTALAFPACGIENAEAGTKKPHIVAVTELQTLECVAAKLYDLSPSLLSQLKKDEPERKGKYAQGIKWDSLRDLGWNTDDKAKQFVRVFLDEFTQASKISAKSAVKANTRILSDRRDAGKLHYLYLDVALLQHDRTLVDQVVALIHKDNHLPDLPVFYFGEDEDAKIAHVSAIIDGFYEDLDEYRRGRLE